MILPVLAVISLIVIGFSMVSRMTYKELASRIALEEGIDPALLLAVVSVESGWNPDARNMTGGDLARGGAYGFGQMTLQTAIGIDPTATPLKLLQPEYNLRICARLIAQLANRFSDPKDIFAAYNSGRGFETAPISTRETYVPKALKYYGVYS